MAFPTTETSVPSDWIGFAASFPEQWTVLEGFRKQVELRPDALAVEQAGRSLSYRELDLRSTRIAGHLLEFGLAPEDVVAVHLPACWEYLVAILGVLKAGGTYFPLATDLPDERLRFLLGDSHSKIVFTNSSGIQRLASQACQTIDVAETSDGPDADEPAPLPTTVPSLRAYIIYTSGSTGHPKGVEIEHGALANFTHCCRQRLDITAHDRAAMLSYIAFDASVFDIWPALVSGGTVVIPPEGIQLEPQRLLEWLAEQRITLAFISTGLMGFLLSLAWPERLALRFLITGGERMRFYPPAGLSFTLVNAYGPTENTVFSTWFDLPLNGEPGDSPPIGRALANTTTRVLDGDMRPVPVGVEGELYLGGRQLARGYLGNPELTRERFVADPFGGAGDRLYRTGDWVRWRPDGQIHFIGRKDGQIQIRGRRVELGEIEAAILTHPAIRQVCCVPWLDDGMPASVVAHVVPAGPFPDLAAVLQSHLQPLLPDFMIPAGFVAHPSLPLNPQGKINRAELACFLPSVPQAESPPDLAENVHQSELAQLWYALLPHASGSPASTTFQSLGGDSLLAMKLLVGVERITGRRLVMSAFLTDPSLAGLRRAACAAPESSDFDPVIMLSHQPGTTPLFFLHGVDGDIPVGMSLHLASILGADHSIYGIRSAAIDDPLYLPDSIETAAAEALAAIRRVQPHGAPMLVGYSFGGLLAFEIARQILATEDLVCFTAIIGPEAPMVAPTASERLTHFCRHFPGWLGDLLGDRANQFRRLRRWRKMAALTGRNVRESRMDIPEWATGTVTRHLISLIDSYRPQSRPDLALDLFLEREEFEARPHPLRAWCKSHLPDGGWNSWTLRPNHIHWVDGTHESILQLPLVNNLAHAIRTVLASCLQNQAEASE